MEGLSIEEKAKAYDEALERARKIKNGEPINVPDGTSIPVAIFPELKEFEDERIRKAMIKCFKWLQDEARWVDVYGNTFDSIFAWLEKQGEKKAAEEIEPTPIFRIGDVIKRKGKDYTFRVDRIQGGYYHCDRNYGAYFPIEDQDNWELVEQNPEWTSMDEQRVENLLAIIEGHGYPGEVAWLNSLKDRVRPQQEWSNWDKTIIESIETLCDDKIRFTEFHDVKEHANDIKEWLKSLKDRILPHPKQEWSEEDKNMLQSILDEYKSMPTEKRNWLKSLKERYTWKPSDAQMNALSVAVKHGQTDDPDALKKLLEQLKKLREE